MMLAGSLCSHDSLDSHASCAEIPPAAPSQSICREICIKLFAILYLFIRIPI